MKPYTVIIPITRANSLRLILAGLAALLVGKVSIAVHADQLDISHKAQS